MIDHLDQLLENNLIDDYIGLEKIIGFDLLCYILPLLICTWFLKNQVWRTGFLVYFELDFWRLHRQ